MLKSKCHNQKGYPFVCKQAERWLVGLGRFLACPELDCYIIYVTNKTPASCHDSRIYPVVTMAMGYIEDIPLPGALATGYIRIIVLLNTLI